MNDTVKSVNLKEMLPSFIFDFGKQSITKKHIDQAVNEQDLMLMASRKKLCHWVGDISIWANYLYFRYNGFVNGNDDRLGCIMDRESKQKHYFSLQTTDDIIGSQIPTWFQFVDSTGFYFSKYVHEAKNLDDIGITPEEDSNPIIFVYQFIYQ